MPDIVSLSSDEGTRLLEESATVDHEPLMSWFEGQKRLRYCSVASSVITLNALCGKKVSRQSGFFFRPGVAAIRGESDVDGAGMTLPELHAVLTECGATVEAWHASDETVDDFRRRAIENLRRPNDFVIVNYLREALGQATGGHFSPLAAWHEGADMFLILDVADFKYPPIWVSPTLLFAAMNTIDSACGRSRGYLSVALSTEGS